VVTAIVGEGLTRFSVAERKDMVGLVWKKYIAHVIWVQRANGNRP
jgi:hypothetical protein